MAGVAPSGQRTVHVVVRGTVQGVGFRWFVRTQARALRVSGWVGNRADGTVEVTANGDSAAIDRLLELLRRGPPGARVDECVVDDVVFANDLETPFDIRRKHQ